MVIEEVEIAIGCLFSVHLFELVAEQAAVQTDEIAFGNFADEGGQVFVLHIGVGIELRPGGGVVGVAIVDEETEFLCRFAICCVAVAIDNKRLGGIVVPFFHERHFHLVLNVLHIHSVAEMQMRHDAIERFGIEGIVGGGTRFQNGVLDFIDAERFF